MEVLGKYCSAAKHGQHTKSRDKSKHQRCCLPQFSAIPHHFRWFPLQRSSPTVGGVSLFPPIVFHFHIIFMISFSYTPKKWFCISFSYILLISVRPAYIAYRVLLWTRELPGPDNRAGKPLHSVNHGLQPQIRKFDP